MCAPCLPQCIVPRVVDKRSDPSGLTHVPITSPKSTVSLLAPCHAPAAGEFGEFDPHHLLAAPKDNGPIHAEAIVNPKPFYLTYIATIEAFIMNVQAIMKAAAIANGEPSPDGLKHLPTYCDDFANVIDSGLSIAVT